MSKKLLTITALTLIIVIELILNSCKEDFPEVPIGQNNLLKTEILATTIGVDFVEVKARLTNYSSKLYSETGFCWSTKDNPTINDSINIQTVVGDTSINSRINNLEFSIKYYVRSYAIYNGIAIYSNSIEVTTVDGLPQITTNITTNITATTATSGGYIAPNGGFNITERGVCYNTSKNPTIKDNKIESGKGTGSFVSNITGLNENTTYYVRAYAINSNGTAYGNERIFAYGVVYIATNSITNITATNATSGGNIISDGGNTITERGVYYSTNQNPTIKDSKIESGKGTGSFVSNITNLTKNTTYYVRAYAINSKGTVYGNQQSFTAVDGLPQLTTATTTTNITAATATSGGNISSNGGFAISKRGICYSKNQNPTIKDSKIESGKGTGSFVSNITNLTKNTTYYIRAFATNNKGTVYGNQQSFTTKDGEPTLTTTAPTNITAITATSGGNISSNGGYSINERGICYGTNQNPTTDNNKIESGNGIGRFTSNITNLTNNTTYYVRAYATNSSGTTYGSQQNFTTQYGLPTLTTTTPTDITATTATSGGKITSNGGYNINERGICYSTNQNPTTDNNKIESGNGTGSFISDITGLNEKTTYYVRAYAINSIGTAYGNEQTIFTGCKDIDGNAYKIVKIGDQMWMGENLKTTHYPNNSAITLTTNATTWKNYDNNDKAYCYYDNSNGNIDAYGALYTFAAANKACPTGWHLPTDTEWTELKNYIISDGYSDEAMASALKSTSGWNSNSSNDIYGFTAIPSGYRYQYDGSYYYEGEEFSLWINSEDDDGILKSASIRITVGSTGSDFGNNGRSVRCIRD